MSTYPTASPHIPPDESIPVRFHWWIGHNKPQGQFCTAQSIARNLIDIHAAGIIDILSLQIEAVFMGTDITATALSRGDIGNIIASIRRGSNWRDVAAEMVDSWTVRNGANTHPALRR